MTVKVTLPVWLEEDKQFHFAAYQQQGLPTRRDECFKYADVSFMKRQTLTASCKREEPERLRALIKQHRLPEGESVLLVSVNGRFVPALSEQEKLPEGLVATGLQQAFVKHPDLIKAHWPTRMASTNYPFACLGAAAFEDGLFVHVPDNFRLAIPLHILSLVTDDQAFTAHARQIVVLGKHSQLIMVEEYRALTTAAYMTNKVSTLTLNEGANLQHFKLQREGFDAAHLAATFVYQQKRSNADFVNITTGGLFSRDDLVVKLQEPGVDCHVSGFYQLSHDGQYVDHHVDISHEAARSKSEMLYKGTLNHRSRVVFNGRLHVAPDAQKILAHQANHNLLLSDTAEVYSKPELEIYADDVKCQHGATMGQLNQDALFYMCSRGISHHEALQILLRGFSEEVTRRIAYSGIRRQVEAQLQMAEG